MGQFVSDWDASLNLVLRSCLISDKSSCFVEKPDRECLARYLLLYPITRTLAATLISRSTCLLLQSRPIIFIRFPASNYPDHPSTFGSRFGSFLLQLLNSLRFNPISTTQNDDLRLVEFPMRVKNKVTFCWIAGVVAYEADSGGIFLLD